MRFLYLVDDQIVTVTVLRSAGAESGRYTVHVGDVSSTVDLLRYASGKVSMRVDGRTVHAVVAADGDRRLVQLSGVPPAEFYLGRSPPSRVRKGAADAHALAATMNSKVVAVEVKVGEIVARGVTLVVLEAMKMESRLTAPHAGRIKLVSCEVGDVVERGRVLVELDLAEEVKSPHGGDGADNPNR